jgi:hypothetical protein
MRNCTAAIASLFALLLICFASAASAQPTSAPSGKLQEILATGTMADAERALAPIASGGGDDAKFALGVAQFLHGVEKLSATYYQFGLKSDVTGEVPFFRLPVPENPNPQPVGLDDLRKAFGVWLDDMDRARQTLAQIKDVEHVKLLLPIARMHLDLNGDGKASDEETCWRLFAAVSGQAGRGEGAEHANPPAGMEDFAIALDGGDVHWLIGYTHALSALPEMALAYDEQELFDRTAHVYFAKPKTPYPYLQGQRKIWNIGGDVDAADLVAIVHLMNFPVKEPQRMRSALAHFQAMIVESRKSWDLILKETDDDREWIPNPRQHSVVPGPQITDARIKAWMEFLDEADAILAGKKLLPFWRGDGEQGVNLNRFFTDPRPLDLVLWIQGSAAKPYLQKGQITQTQRWQQWQGVFDGNLFPFAAWFN